MNVDWAGLPDAIRELLAEPGANLGPAVLLLAAVTIVVLVFVVAAVMVALPKRRRAPGEPSEEAEGAEPAEERKRRRGPLPLVVWTVAIAALVVAALAVAYSSSATDRFCLGCHVEIDPAAVAALRPMPIIQSAEVPTVVSAESTAPPGPHAEVACVSCHEDALPHGLVANVVARLRYAVRASAETTPPAIPGTDSRRCLRCHADIAEGPLVVGAIVMSHAEPLASGMICFDCHVGLGHTGTSGPAPGMAVCVRCHDGIEASAACESCHLGGPARSVGRVFAPRVLATTAECGGCHDERGCDACHGLRMPHAAEFKAYDHARFSAFGKKVLCWRCHTVGDCNSCHETKEGIWGHGSGDTWKRQHGELPPESRGCGCHAGHPAAAAGDFCKACH